MPCLREKANLPLYISFLQLKTLLSFLPIHSSHFPSLGQTPRICPTFLAREDRPRLTTSLWRYSLHSYLTQNLLFSSWKETQEPPFCFSLTGSCSSSTLLNYLFLPSGGSWLRLSLNDTSNQPPQSDARGSITRVSCNHSTNSLFFRVFRTIQHPDDSFSFDIWADFQPTLYLRHHLAPREQIAACGKSSRGLVCGLSRYAADLVHLLLVTSPLALPLWAIQIVLVIIDLRFIASFSFREVRSDSQAYLTDLGP